VDHEVRELQQRVGEQLARNRDRNEDQEHGPEGAPHQLPAPRERRANAAALELDDRPGEREPSEEDDPGDDEQQQADRRAEPEQQVDRDQPPVRQTPRHRPQRRWRGSLAAAHRQPHRAGVEHLPEQRHHRLGEEPEDERNGREIEYLVWACLVDLVHAARQGFDEPKRHEHGDA
jgi:hypothetical protein